MFRINYRDKAGGIGYGSEVELGRFSGSTPVPLPVPPISLYYYYYLSIRYIYYIETIIHSGTDVTGIYTLHVRLSDRIYPLTPLPII